MRLPSRVAKLEKRSPPHEPFYIVVAFIEAMADGETLSRPEIAYVPVKGTTTMSELFRNKNENEQDFFGRIEAAMDTYKS